MTNLLLFKLRRTVSMQLLWVVVLLAACTPKPGAQSSEPQDGSAGTVADSGSNMGVGDGGVADSGIAGGDGGTILRDAGGTIQPTEGGQGFGAAPPAMDDPGFVMFRDQVVPALVQNCQECHVGKRFAFASLEREGSQFTPAEHLRNYQKWVDQLSLDSPRRSRVLAKILPQTHPDSALHRAGPQIADETDPLYVTLLAWAELEKARHCPGCGLTAAKAYVAYVVQPEGFWAVAEDPIRTDRGERRGARIMLQPANSQTAQPQGAAVDFLAGNANGFCADNDCDFRALAPNHAGTALVWECRMAVNGESWLQRAWNVCIAGIDDNGRAVNPRFLMPPDQRHQGFSYARITPFALVDSPPDGVSPYNKHYQGRRRSDRSPIFSADDTRVIVSSSRPDPRSGVDMVQTYHGTFYLSHIISVALDGSDPRTLYRNEGGSADLPFHLRNGNLAFHTWNLDRMDRHMYVQSTADGMMELPVLGGAMQGPNMWGPAFQTNNGRVLGLSGRRRGELENYAPFWFDHTLGVAGVDQNFTETLGFQFVPPGYLDEIGDYPNGYCPSGGTPATNANTPNCFVSRLTLDPSYLPDGRALVAYNPEKTYIGIGERFYLNYGSGNVTETAQYLPKRLGIGVVDQAGNATTLINNQDGFMDRYPVWVAVRQRPHLQTAVTDEDQTTADLHIADFRVWLTFADGTNTTGSKSTAFRNEYEPITSVRVLRKISDKNACIADNRYIRMSNAGTNGYHPGVLGFIDATGFEQYVVPASAGGNAWGDIPLAADGSVNLRLPAGELLLFQGIDDDGNLAHQHSRLFAMPPGHRVDTSVRRTQYFTQCASCHGTIVSGESVTGARDTASLPAIMDFNTLAKALPPVDLTASGVTHRALTYRAALRPLLDSKCVSCHQGESPAGELSLQEAYSPVGNYPAGSWAQSPDTFSGYLSFMDSVPAAARVPSYNFSVAYSFFLNDDYQNYKDQWATEVAMHLPLAELAPWDAGYQNLFRRGGNGFRYLNSVSNATAFGRVTSTGGNASRAWLLEILTGQDHDPNQVYSGTQDHVGMLTQAEIRLVRAVLDVGMPYAARCDEKMIPSGLHAGKPWGQATDMAE